MTDLGRPPVVGIHIKIVPGNDHQPLSCKLRDRGMEGGRERGREEEGRGRGEGRAELLNCEREHSNATLSPATSMSTVVSWPCASCRA